ncbi:MAG: hypothetical protein KAS18_01690, partial [Calditrichia bacterium]|nr:hypothetical protein [Calditrichia bacterium]
MKTILFFALCFIFMTPIFSQSKLDFSSIMLKSEQNPQISNNALKLAIEKNLPTSIFISEEVFIQPVIVHNNEVLYSVITDFRHTFNGGYLATFDEIENKFDLNKSEIRYFGDSDSFINNELSKYAPGDSLYLIPESTNKRIMAFNMNGTLVDSMLIPPHSSDDTLDTPIEALYSNVRKSFIISDQVLDIVQEFDITGMFITTYAPKGGRAVNTLDNVSGMAFHPNGNLLVSVGWGTNRNAIAEFDIFGNFVGNFIIPADSIMDSPFDVLVRANDVLIPAITSNGIHKYDLSGNYIEDFATGIVFPEQVAELSNGEIAVANFSSPNSGIQIYPAGGGNFTQLLTGVTGNRGVAELANGNLLTTNGSGIYIIDRTTGNVIETKIAGVSARFISLYIVEENLNNAIFSVSQNSINFGNVAKDSSKTDTLMIRNEGDAQLLVLNAFSNHA